MDELEAKVNGYVNDGDDVIIVTISSKISGTYNAIYKLFEGVSAVRVIDSLSAVGGLRLIVEEINRCRDLPVDEIIARINALIPRICIIAIPETFGLSVKRRTAFQERMAVRQYSKLKAAYYHYQRHGKGCNQEDRT